MASYSNKPPKNPPPLPPPCPPLPYEYMSKVNTTPMPQSAVRLEAARFDSESQRVTFTFAARNQVFIPFVFMILRALVSAALLILLGYVGRFILHGDEIPIVVWMSKLLNWGG